MPAAAAGASPPRAIVRPAGLNELESRAGIGSLSLSLCLSVSLSRSLSLSLSLSFSLSLRVRGSFILFPSLSFTLSESQAFQTSAPASRCCHTVTVSVSDSQSPSPVAA